VASFARNRWREALGLFDRVTSIVSPHPRLEALWQHASEAANPLRPLGWESCRSVIDLGRAFTSVGRLVRILRIRSKLAAHFRARRPMRSNLTVASRFRARGRRSSARLNTRRLLSTLGFWLRVGERAAGSVVGQDFESLARRSVARRLPDERSRAARDCTLVTRDPAAAHLVRSVIRSVSCSSRPAHLLSELRSSVAWLGEPNQTR
jgi:hypothetical protein